MSGKSEKYIRRAVGLMLLTAEVKTDVTTKDLRRVFTRKTKQIHHANPGLVKRFLGNWTRTPVDAHPLETKVQAAVIAGQKAVQKGLRNRRAKLAGA
jgi:hypothetical protein